MEEELTK